MSAYGDKDVHILHSIERRSLKPAAMRQHWTLLLGAGILLLFSISGSPAREKATTRLQSVVNRLGGSDRIYVWVYFTDKGSHETMRQSIPLSIVSERSITRRKKVLPSQDLVDYTDLPVEQSYIDQVAVRVGRVRQRSKWFNGVSVVATRGQLSSLEVLPFVKELDLLARFGKNQTEQEEFNDGAQQLAPRKENGTHALDYGASFAQVNQINVPAVHDLGNHAEGVIVGVFDNGFRLPNHEAFSSMYIIAQYDFVDHKVSVVPNNPSASFGTHGVNTLSTIGGYTPGQLIGPAFAASFILARTENDSSETPIEEDNWVAAIEWADSIGVDITSTSLGYLTYDTPYTSWTWQDMNGNATAITRAADWAVSRGIVVVNSAGNNGDNASHNTLNAPADGDSVLTVGAVDATGLRSSFSSVGPTTCVPSHTKPDVMAQGSSVRVASATNTTGYGSASGTSFSCPLAAGVAALVVHARPNATPIQIMNSMRSTASRAAGPDNQYGWGILDALAAINGIPLSIQLHYFTATVVHNPSGVRLDWGTLSEVNNFGFTVQRRADSTEFADLTQGFLPGHGTTIVPHEYSFTDNSATTGTWFYRIKQIDLDGTVHCSDAGRVDIITSVSARVPADFALDQNYPNPFNASTTLKYRLPTQSYVTLKVFDMLGKEVVTLVDAVEEPGYKSVSFSATVGSTSDGDASRKVGIASGVYYYRITAGDFVQTKRLVLLK